MKRPKPTTSDLRTAHIVFLGIKEGTVFTDAKGRKAAIGRYRYELFEIVNGPFPGEAGHAQDRPAGNYHDELFDKTVKLWDLKPTEAVEVEMQAYEHPDSADGWEPCEDVAKRAMELLAVDGLTKRRQLQEMRDARERQRILEGKMSRSEGLAIARRTAEAIRIRAPETYFTRKGMLREIADKSGIPFGTVRDWHQAGDLPLKLSPDD